MISYSNGILQCESVNLKLIAEEVGTPCYVYSAGMILSQYQTLIDLFKQLDFRICYATKANSNLSILKLLAERGVGFDIVSGGELFKVIQAGGHASDCTFAGVGKTGEDIAYALHEGIYSFNIESKDELDNISKIAQSIHKIARISLRINPDVEATTHHYTMTGTINNKFGIPLEESLSLYDYASSLPAIKIAGIQMHIGSQILQYEPFFESIKKILPTVRTLKQKYDIEYFSIGGGLGIPYTDVVNNPLPSLLIEEYAKEILPLLSPLNVKIIVEPGRFIVGNAGLLLTRVLYIKETGKKFVIVDSGMNDLIRPALYDSHHEIVPVSYPTSDQLETVDVVGPVCESGDFLAQNYQISPVKIGDYLAVLSAGAYCFSMSSTYNSRPLVSEVLITNGRAKLIRKRDSWNDLIRSEVTPEEIQLSEFHLSK